jgi:hypothetical protein
MSTLLTRNRVLQLCVVLLVLGSSFFVWNTYLRGSKALRTNPVLKNDYRILKNEDASTRVEAIAMALHRLNSYRLPEGLSEALKRVKDPRPQVRGAVAEGLAMNVLRGEVLAAEIELLSDSDESLIQDKYWKNDTGKPLLIYI